MGQVRNELLASLIKEAYEYLSKKDQLIFETKIELYNLSREKSLSKEQLTIFYKKIKLDFEIINLTMESTVQGIALQLLELKKENKSFEVPFSFFQKFSVRKQPSYVLKQKKVDSNERAKEANSKVYLEEQLAHIQKYVANISQIDVYESLFNQLLQLFAQVSVSLENSTVYSKGKLMDNKMILQELLDFEYKEDMFDENKFRNFFKLIVFVYEGIVLEEVNAYPARKINRNFKNSGFRATAYEVKQNGFKEVYFVFKGTEGSVTTLKNLLSDVIYNNLISEALADWKYNFESIILGTGKAQVEDGIQFIRLIKKHLKPQNVYATGHSLGGHLAQTIQLIDAPFEQVYTVNSAPIQVRQLHSLKPHLLSAKNWDIVMNRLEEMSKWSESNNEFIREVFKEQAKNITNDSFNCDFTRTLIYLHGTSLIGETNYYSINLNDFPSKYNIREYFSESDLLYLYELMEHNIDWNLKNDSHKSVLKGIFSIINDKNKIVPSNQYKKQTVDFLLKVLNYMDDNYLGNKEELERKRASLLAGETLDSFEAEPNKKKQLSSVLLSLKNDFAFIFNLNRDTLELIIYLHGMSGGKWIMRTGKLIEKN